MDLAEYFKQHVRAEAQEIEYMDQVFETLEYEKGCVLQMAGRTAQYLYFIERGLARMYYHNEAGKDFTYGFYEEADFLTVPDSFFNRAPSLYAIELLEDATLRRIGYGAMEEALVKMPGLEKVKSMVLLLFLVKASQRVVALQFQNAQQRYGELVSKQPSIVLRAPLGHVASFLGITQETLSRIRARK